MPKNKVNDPITGQEMAFAHLVLSGAMTDRQAAEAAGLNPDSAAYTKAKPRVRDYMLQHRANVQPQPVQQEAPGREQVLDRLWEIANLSPEMTRHSVTGQVKALSIIVAIQNFIPNSRAASAAKQSSPGPTAQIYQSAWLRQQRQATTVDPQPNPDPTQEEDSPVRTGPEPAPNSAEASPDPAPSQSTFANRVTPAEAHESYIPLFTSVADTRLPFSLKKNPFIRRPR
jgi:hypothetical protein